MKLRMKENHKTEETTKNERDKSWKLFARLHRYGFSFSLTVCQTQDNKVVIHFFAILFCVIVSLVEYRTNIRVHRHRSDEIRKKKNVVGIDNKTFRRFSFRFNSFERTDFNLTWFFIRTFFAQKTNRRQAENVELKRPKEKEICRIVTKFDFWTTHFAVTTIGQSKRRRSMAEKKLSRTSEAKKKKKKHSKFENHSFSMREINTKSNENVW